MGKIKVADVTNSSMNILKELNRKIFPILTASQISEDFYEDFLEDDLGFAILAYYGDMLAGASCCQIEDDNSIYLRFIGVANRHRRKGVGSEMMRNIIKRGEERDVHRIYMYVRVDNKAAIRLGRKFGFNVVEERGGDLTLMEKVLHK